MELRIDEAKNIAYIKLSGQPDRQTILNAFDATVRDKQYKSGMGRLWDFRDADVASLNASTIADMAKYSTKFPTGIDDVKVAIVVRRQVEFGLARMFEAFSQDAKTTVSVFYSMEEAETWMAVASG